MSTAMASSAVAEQPKNVFARILGIFINPRETMDDIAARPTWIVPMVLVILTSVLSVVLLQDIIMDKAAAEMAKNPNMTQEQIDQAMPFVKGVTWISVLVGVPIINVLIAGLFIFIGNVILGGQTNFKTAFSVTSWSGLISVLGSLILIPILRAKGELTSATSLSFLDPSGDEGAPLFFLLSQIDLFRLWGMIVLGLGFAAAYKFSSKKGVTTALVVWGIFVVLGTALKAIF